MTNNSISRLAILPLMLMLLAYAFSLELTEAADLTRGETRIRVAAISFVPKKFDLAHNVNRLEKAYREAAKGGAKIAVAPEGVLEGYVVNEIIDNRCHDVAR